MANDDEHALAAKTRPSWRALPALAAASVFAPGSAVAADGGVVGTVGSGLKWGASTVGGAVSRLGMARCR